MTYVNTEHIWHNMIYAYAIIIYTLYLSGKNQYFYILFSLSYELNIKCIKIFHIIPMRKSFFFFYSIILHNRKLQINLSYFRIRTKRELHWLIDFLFCCITFSDRLKSHIICGMLWNIKYFKSCQIFRKNPKSATKKYF